MKENPFPLFVQKQHFSAQVQSEIPWLFRFIWLSVLADNLKETEFPFTKISLFAQKS